MVITKENEFTTPVLKETILDAYNRLIAPAIEREIRNDLTEPQVKDIDNLFNYTSALLKTLIAAYTIPSIRHNGIIHHSKPNSQDFQSEIPKIIKY